MLSKLINYRLSLHSADHYLRAPPGYERKSSRNSSLGNIYTSYILYKFDSRPRAPLRGHVPLTCHTLQSPSGSEAGGNLKRRNVLWREYRPSCVRFEQQANRSHDHAFWLPGCQPQRVGKGGLGRLIIPYSGNNSISQH